MQTGRTDRASDEHIRGDQRNQPPNEAAVREELGRVLAGHEFRASKRSQEFLRYIIENTLNGRAAGLKERMIGVVGFGRAVSYDPSEDATVRVKAGEVRGRLGLYYAGEGNGNSLRIELPTGSYVPEFRYPAARPREEPVLAPNVSEPVPAPKEPHLSLPPRTASFWRRPVGWYGVVAALTAAAVIGSLLWQKPSPAAIVLNEFWAPVLEGNAPVSLCAAFVPLLGRDPHSQDPFRPEYFTLFSDQFVGGGDLIAVSRLSSMLTRRNRAYRVRIGNEISFHDLKNAPAVLIGYSHTPWNAIAANCGFSLMPRAHQSA